MVVFQWDDNKERENIAKHGVSFSVAIKAFEDENYLLLPDIKHSKKEERLVCLGKVGDRVMTVRFTYRGEIIRIFGAAYWRKGKKEYEKNKK